MPHLELSEKFRGHDRAERLKELQWDVRHFGFGLAQQPISNQGVIPINVFFSFMVVGGTYGF